MNQEERKRRAVQVLEGIHNDVRRSIHRAVGIMGDSGQGMTEIIVLEINAAPADVAKGGAAGFAFIPYNPALPVVMLPAPVTWRYISICPGSKP
jgi:hypothetical protein